MQFYFNESSFDLMMQMQLSEKILGLLKYEHPKSVMNRAEIDALLEKLLPNPKKQHASRQIILEASAIIAYQSLPQAIKILLCDDE